MLLNKTIPMRYIIKKIGPDMTLSMSFVLLIILSKQLITYDLKLPVTIPAFLGTAISLVLAFKLSQSYDRWWEARKIWGAIVNDSRSLIIQVLNFYNGQNSSKNEDAKSFSYRQIAWCYALSNSLRKLNPYENLDNYLSKEEITELKKHANVPLKIAELHSQHLKTLFKENKINQFQQVQIDSTLVRLVASMGKAERIKNTVFPKTYRIFLRFFIYVFILALAISLSNLNPYFEISLLFFITLPFFLLKKTALLIQDPFENNPTDTAMNTISKTIEMNLRQLIGEKYLPSADEKPSFYVM